MFVFSHPFIISVFHLFIHRGVELKSLFLLFEFRSIYWKVLSTVVNRLFTFHMGNEQFGVSQREIQ